MKLIFHSDDLGLSYGLTEGIRNTFINGLTTSTSIRTNGFAYRYALKLLKKDLLGIGLGLHLNLTQGQPYLEALKGPTGNYRWNFLGYLLNLKRPGILEQVTKELERQFEIALFKDKLPLDHVNGHDHIHMIPEIFEIVCRLCRKYDVKYIRLSNENYYLTFSKNDLLPFFNQNIIKFLLLKKYTHQNQITLKRYGLKTSNSFYGILHTNNMNVTTVIKAIDDAINRRLDVIEILLHPGFTNDVRDTSYLDDLAKWYCNLPQRIIERKTLQHSLVKKFIHKYHIELTNYHRLHSPKSTDK